MPRHGNSDTSPGFTPNRALIFSIMDARCSDVSAHGQSCPTHIRRFTLTVFLIWQTSNLNRKHETKTVKLLGPKQGIGRLHSNDFSAWDHTQFQGPPRQQPELCHALGATTPKWAVSIQHGRNIGRTWGQFRPAAKHQLRPNLAPRWRNLAQTCGPS